MCMHFDVRSWQTFRDESALHEAAKKSQRPGSPLSSQGSRAVKFTPAPATRSVTTRDTRVSPGRASDITRVYSIDECFLDLERLPVKDLTAWCRDLRGRAERWTGIPVSVGIGTTKTLSKIANKLAKMSAKADGVIDLVGHPEWIETALTKTPVGDVWGIGFHMKLPNLTVSQE